MHQTRYLRNREEKRRQLTLSARDRRFIEEFAVDLDVKEASARCGIDADVGKRLLGQTHIQMALARERAKQSSRTEIYSDEVLRRWWMLATADPRELVQLRRVCCRFCYGIEHHYQYTPEELRRAGDVDSTGGDGYDGTLPPAEDCPECFGEGTPTVWLEDSRNYSPGAALLYEGVKVSKDGTVELKLRDRSNALEQVAKHLGMFVQRQINFDIDPTKLTDDQLDSVLRQFADLAGPQTGPLLEHSPEGENEEVNGSTGS